MTNCLKASIDEQKDWIDCLQSIAMAYRAGVHASTGKSPYEVMFGLRMRMPVHLLTQPFDDVDGDPDSDEEVEIEPETRSYEEIFSELEQVRVLIHDSCAANISTAQAKQAKDYDACHRGAPLQVGDLIMNYNTKAKQRKGDRMAPNWTGPYTILKVHKNGNYSVKNSKGEALTTELCASNVKLWQEPTNWENEPAPDWISAQLLDDSEPTIPATEAKVKHRKNQKSVKKPEPAEPWIKGPSYDNGDSSSDDDYEGEPPVKQAEYPISSPPPLLQRLAQKRREHENVTSSQPLQPLLKSVAQKRKDCESLSQPLPPKKVRFTGICSDVLPTESDAIDTVHYAIKNKIASKKKRSFAEHKERKAEERKKQKDRKDKFYEQMLSVGEDSTLPDLTETKDQNVRKESLFTCDDSPNSSDSDVAILDVKEGKSFKFLPLQYNNRKAICDRIALIIRKTEMGHSQVGESLDTREPRVTCVKGDGNCLFRALCVGVTGWETGHMKIRQLVCDHINDVGPYNSKDASDGPRYLSDSHMRKDAVYGTDVEIFSAAQVLSTDIYVYHRYGDNGLKWLYFPCVHGSGNWRNAIYLDNRSGNGVNGHFDYVTGLKPQK